MGLDDVRPLDVVRRPLTCNITERRREQKTQHDESDGRALPGAPGCEVLLELEPPRGKVVGRVGSAQVVPDGEDGHGSAEPHGASANRERTVVVSVEERWILHNTY